MRELRGIDVSSYQNFVRMNAVTFETLLNMVAPLIFRKDTNMREAIPPGERARLAITLRFLATGEDLLEMCVRPVSLFTSIMQDLNCIRFVIVVPVLTSCR